MKSHIWLVLLIILFIVSITFGQNQQTDPAVPKILYTIPNQEKSSVVKNVVYKKIGEKQLEADIYSPAEMKSGTLLPVVLFLSGASEAKSWNVFKNYGELTAANGIIGVTFDKRFPQGEAGFTTGLEDTNDLISFLRQNADKYNIDKDRICLWAFSAGGSLIFAGMQENKPFIRCLVSYYAITPMNVRRQVTTMGDKLPPMLIARAGKDNQFINNSIDLFIQEAVNRNARVNFYNYPDGVHAFELFNDTETTREILRHTFQFVKDHLGAK
jgi:acetyl esterase/lipase